MAISIDWGTRVIFVPKADTALVQASPEVRELDVDWFRLQLKSLEDDENGMAFPDTHNHNTEITISGIVYARTIEIINGYTVEFENGSYSISCKGANHNLADVKVPNSVSLIINNAAGLISPDDFDAPTIADAVWDESTIDHLGSGTFGEKIGNKLLTVAKFVGLK